MLPSVFAGDDGIFPAMCVVLIFGVIILFASIFTGDSLKYV